MTNIHLVEAGVGYIVGHVIYETADIDDLFVCEEARGKGYGTKLLQAFVAKVMAAGAEEILLEVRPSNEAALKLYKKFGFETLYERENYYSDGEKAQVMRMVVSNDEKRNSCISN